MTGAVRTLWAHPRAPDPPARVWRDWVLVAVFVGTSVVEGLTRRDLLWRPVAVLEAVVLAFVFLWRRTHPLAVTVVGFAVPTMTDLAFAVTGHADGSVNLYTMAYLLLLPYAVFRWGSGREVVLGSAFFLVVLGLGVVRDGTDVAETGVGAVVLVFPMVLGALIRSWAVSRLRELDRMRLRERELLARDLHDTVAHHVSAMVIRAQAGRVVGRSRPEAALEALETIEGEGSRALAELRGIVTALREHEEVDLVPHRGVADIARFARSQGDGPRIEVHLSGELDDLGPAVSAAAYRLAQESVTNALRHARHATRILVEVTGEPELVRLVVRDDGDAVPAVRAPDGYGLVGMTERATLVGGRLDAGPGPDRGWVVDAVLPRPGGSTR